MTKSQVKDIYKNTKSDFQTTIIFASVISLFLILTYFIFYILETIDYSSNYTSYFISLIFVLFSFYMVRFLEPFIYSFFANNGGLRTDRRDEIGLGSFIKTYSIGRKPPFRGRLQIFKILCITLLIFIGVFLLSGILGVIIAQFKGNTFNEIYNEINLINMESEDSLVQLEGVLNEFDEFIQSFRVHTTFVCLLPSFYYFCHRICTNTLKYFVVAPTIGIPHQVTNTVFKISMKSYKPKYLKEYYRAVYPLTILFVVLFSAVYYLLYAFLPYVNNLILLAAGAIVIVLFLTLPFFSLILNTNNEIFSEFFTHFLTTFITLTESDLARYEEEFRGSKLYDERVVKQTEENIVGLRNKLESIKKGQIESKTKEKEHSDQRENEEN